MTYSSYRNITWTILFIFTFSTTLIPSISIANPDDSRKINVIFRFDDYSARSETEVEKRIIETFREHNIPFTVGVIPFVCEVSFFDTAYQQVIPLDSVKGQILQKAYEDGIVEVGLHGYSHQTIDPSSNNTEFEGLDYNEQVFRMQKGKDFLENLTGARVSSFIPPWNRYDKNTLNVLEELNFNSISASIIGTFIEPTSIKYIPGTCEIFDLKDAVEYARKNDVQNPNIIVLFHSYDFNDSVVAGKTLTMSMFSDVLEWTATQKDINTMTINEAALTVPEFDVDRFKLNVKIVDINLLIPPFFRPAVTGLYVNHSDLTQIQLRLIGFYGILIIILIVIVGFFNKILFKSNIKAKKIIKYIITFVLALALIYTFMRGSAGYKVLIINAILLGTTLGLWITTDLNKVKSTELKV
jgi:peptidoglycan/xylan/chitin deacetylase (PgdA/CDA1 family)